MAPFALVALVALFWIAGAQGVPGGGTIFELDASLDQSNGSAPKAAITDNAANAIPDDWDRVCHSFTITFDPNNAFPNQCVSAGDDHADARSFDSETAADGTADARTIFTGGGSKDQQPLSKWAYKDQLGGLPDKDNLLHAMSARYNTANNSYIFFGADRYDNSGDAQIGFWFFKSTVCTKPDGGFGNTVTNGVCSGTAVHAAGVVPHNTTDPTKQGDILILSDFTNGGVQPTIRIFEYVGSGGSDGELNQIGGGADENRDCAVVSTDDFCASVNNFDGAAAPWLFKNKSNANSFGHGEFYEGGLNLNTLGLQNECFASFLAETRSSQSVTATLKDFVLGGFEACQADVVTTPSDASGNALPSITLGGSIYDHAVITGTGSNQNPTGTMSFFICSPAQLTNGVCSSGGTEVNGSGANALNPPATVTPIANSTNSEALSSAFTPTSVGTWCWRGVYSGDTRYPADTDASSGECFQVNTIPTDTSTAQNWTPNDTATISTTGPAGYNLTGSVTFTLYGPNDPTCAGTKKYEETVSIPANAGLTEDVKTTNGDGSPASGLSADFKVAKAGNGTYSWKVVYTPAQSDTGHTGSDSPCHEEHSDLTITEP